MTKRKLLTALAVSSFFISITFYACNSESSQKNSDLVDYNFQIRPILSDRCFQCHGPDANKREADLRLDTPEGAYAALKENPEAHALVKGKPQLSEAFLRMTTSDSTLRMPPIESNLKLTEEEINLIKKWIDQGAEYKPHWAFIAPQKNDLPEADEDWVKNEIDHFAYAKMRAQGLNPNEEASKEALLKRVTLDLTGLLPTLEEQDAFINDESEDAYEKVVDRLLKSKHYGEKMALPWLDLARYADSHGYQDDGLRTMWPWRDWVIHAFNENYSYQKFVTWQLAGDQIKNSNKESLLATGFNRNHKITQEGGVIDEEYRIEYVTDRTNTFGKGLLALTFECAHCHDHKYDPISQKDYYSTFAFFNQVPEKGLFGTIDASFADPPNMKITDEDVQSILKFVNKKDSADMAVMVMKDSSITRPTYLLERGNYDAHGEAVGFALPESIMAFDTSKYPKNRLGLSQWLFDQENPLTARVFVNRLWEQFYGQGIVKTTGDFGMQGDLPTHPELLDWLAVDFMENDWDIKAMVKKMVMSATYRQSSDITEKHLKTDPENLWLARTSRIRVAAEHVRDVVLHSSGLLNLEIGGPSVKPYQPEGIWEVATSGRGLLAKYVQDHGEDLYRRGMYVFIKRTVPPPSMLIFDASNRDQCEVRRLRTNTPLQALSMLNDPTVQEASRVLAEKLVTQKNDVENKLDLAFRKIICRTPKSDELEVLLDYYEQERKYFKENPDKAKALLNIGEYKAVSARPVSETAAMMHTIQLIYNLEEALMRI
ncbi:PSD1 and planctomycete cytochrome C domain-containing protein [Jiulongibacter sp. NS-SX5]|uniref:PSD1 and planctomycete cytochrome C domain-containing protein n=1 Tax=Jiulongibacter sp. NS-SX5 TaxID=3463854 RepID=UPI00405A42F1